MVWKWFKNKKNIALFVSALCFIFRSFIKKTIIENYTAVTHRQKIVSYCITGAYCTLAFASPLLCLMVDFGQYWNFDNRSQLPCFTTPTCRTNHSFCFPFFSSLSPSLSLFSLSSHTNVRSLFPFVVISWVFSSASLSSFLADGCGRDAGVTLV